MKKLMFKMKKAAIAASLICVSANVFGMENQRWFEAVRSGNLVAIDQMINEGTDLNARDTWGRTALIIAVENNDREVVEHLLTTFDPTETQVIDLVLDWKRNGRRLEEQDLQRHLRIWKAFGIDERDGNGKTALEIALTELEMVLTKAAYYDRKEYIEKISKYKRIVELLIDAGADGNIKFCKDREEEGGPPRVETTPLIYAVEEGNVEMVRKLIDKDADVSAGEYFGKYCIGTPLTFAMKSGSERRGEIVRLLLEKGADVNAKLYRYPNECPVGTSLTFAVKSGNMDVVQQLVDRGADVNAKDEDGKTALISAVEKGNVEIVRLLLERNANVKATTEDGKTVLMYAVEKGNVEIVQLLLDKDVDVNAENKTGQTALISAVEKGNVEIVQLLLEKGADVNAGNDRNGTALVYAILGGNEEIVQLLLDKDVDVNVKAGWSEATALMYAVRKGNIEIVRILLDKGADINAKDEDGETALMYAVEKGNKEIEKLLRTKKSAQRKKM